VIKITMMIKNKTRSIFHCFNIFIFLCLFLFSCRSLPDSADKTPVITSHAKLDNYVGEVITIEGKVSRTKLPTIIGVDIKADYNLSDKKCRATGKLLKGITTEEEAAQLQQKGVAHRGAGTFYRLGDVNSGETAKAYPVKK
jgi:hypothetical protein